ncbi:hypothetical protein AU15_03610 [Marinobacter salarius]|uniref:Uncharacterized protein n=1 Tax=Marinobacter salarius TaxID=1420917 RepID=W5YUU3_9GAMM|nr:hypothetical protein AU15_03610 [Marinobacter salarius]
MPGIRLSQNAAGHRQLWKMVVAGMALAIMAGCQEDSGASRAASSQANEASEQRLGDAVSSIRDTLGQPEPVQEETSNTGVPADEESITLPHYAGTLRSPGKTAHASMPATSAAIAFIIACGTETVSRSYHFPVTKTLATSLRIFRRVPMNSALPPSTTAGWKASAPTQLPST